SSPTTDEIGQWRRSYKSRAPDSGSAVAAGELGTAAAPAAGRTASLLGGRPRIGERDRFAEATGAADATGARDADRATAAGGDSVAPVFCATGEDVDRSADFGARSA